MGSVDACKCVHGADRGHTGTRTGRECAFTPDKTGIFVRHWKLQKASSPFLFVVVQEKNWCGRWESNPHEEKSPEDFHAVYGFRRPDADALQHSRPVCGLDYPFTVPRKVRGLGAARLVSTPSRLDSFAGLGSGLPLQVSPNLSSSASPVSRRALKFRLSPQRLPFRHARTGGYSYL